MKVFLSIMICSSFLFALDNNSELERKKRIEKQIQEEIEKEKKFAQEQAFYHAENYNLKRSEVNKDSVDRLPIFEIDDSDSDYLEMEDEFIPTYK